VGEDGGIAPETVQMGLVAVAGIAFEIDDQTLSPFRNRARVT